MTVDETIQDIETNHTMTEIVEIIERLRQHVTSNALLREHAERANNEFFEKELQGNISEKFYYGLTHPVN